MKTNSWLNVGVLAGVKTNAAKVVRSPTALEETEGKLDTAPREWYTVFKLRGVRYVPHYYNTHFYVGPGFPKHTQEFYTAAQLTAFGAVMSQSYLLTRSNTKAAHELVGNLPKKVVRIR